MKINALYLVLLILISSCKNKTKDVNYPEEVLSVTTSIYPETISKVFSAHGGLDRWNAQQSLSFTMPKPDGNEVTLTALKSRKSLITMPKHILGFDGETPWLKKKDTVSYKGDPKFYYNLMFYFYAMPFVLADDGIIYEDVKPLHFEGKYYPGIKIAYESGVGESPEDEYVLYFDEETNKMEWLSYTVTYFSKEKSKDFRFIRYKDWQSINNLILPKTLVWYNLEDGKLTTEKNTMEFVDVILSTTILDASLFEMPKDAEKPE